MDSICPANQTEWRSWLEGNHLIRDSIWLVVFKKGSATPTITWSESVDQALCFGWIDGIKKSIDDEKYRQYFCKRKPKSTWSKINKDKVDVLIQQGLMREAGFRSIEIAKSNGSWSILDEVEALVVPKDLMLALRTVVGAKDFFESLSKSVRKGLLHWVVLAKKPETRKKRIIEIVENAGKKRKPKQFR